MYLPTFIIVYNVHFLRDNVDFFNIKVCAIHVIEGKMVNFLGLLHFTSQHIMCFAHCPFEFQNRAMYPISLIIVCNVHFFRDDVIFFI